MLEEQLLKEFRERISEATRERVGDLDSSIELQMDAAFTEVALEYLGEAGLVSEHDLCPHEDKEGRGRCRVVAYSLPDDSTRLEIFTAVYSDGTDETLPTAEISRLTGWAARFFGYAAKGDLQRFISNKPAEAAAKFISNEIDRIDDVRVHLLTNLLVRSREINDDGIEILGRPIQFDVWDLERLYRASGEEVTRDRIEIDFVKLLGRPLACLEMKPPPQDYQTFLVVLPGNLVYQLYEEYGAQLFELNVRSFLQGKGNVNKGIKSTIEKEPERFLAYNNGLTATADEIEVSTFHGETVIQRLKGLQIVNGAQTTASIHRAKKVDKLPLDGVAVSMKLTRVKADKLQEFVPLIARFANTQNPIQLADLSANDKFQQRFEDLSENFWCPGEETRWFYERARGSYQVARMRAGTTSAKRREFDETFPKSQYFGKADLAKYLMSWWGFPQIVSKGAQKNYGAFMLELRERFGDGWEPDQVFYRHTIAIALLFKAAQSAVRGAKLQSYGANVVTYLIAKLAAEHGMEIDFDLMWETQEVSPELRVVFSTWAPLVHAKLIESAAKRNVTEWCKKIGCWEALQTLPLPLPSPPPPELGPAGGPEKAATRLASTEDSDVIACTGLGGADWAKIVAWAAKSPEIDDYDRRVANTLCGYAMEGWKRPPSEKQAVRGARVLDAARRAQII
jgi:hypothetical protein